MPYTAPIFTYEAEPQIPPAYRGRSKPSWFVGGRRLSENFPPPFTNQGGDQIPPEAIVEAYRVNARLAKSRAELVVDGAVVQTPVAGSVIAGAKLIEVRHYGGDLFVLDYESVRSIETLTKCAAAVREEWPTARLTCYGVLPYGTWGDAIAAAADSKHPLHAKMKAQKPLFDWLDYALANVYMLGPHCFPDFCGKIIRALRSLYRKHYPNCEVLNSIAGSHFGTADGAPLKCAELKIYVPEARRLNTACIVWNPTAPRDDSLFDGLVAA